MKPASSARSLNMQTLSTHIIHRRLITRSTLARHEWSLVAGVLLIYFHVISVAIPTIPYVPLLLIYPAILALFAIFLYSRQRPHSAILQLYSPSYRKRFFLFILAIGLMLIHGHFRGNGFFHIGTELGFFLILAFFLLIGGRDRVWHIIDRPMTIMVYVTFALMLVFKDTMALQQIEGTYDPNIRLTNTVAYELRPMMSPAVFIFIWGCVNTRSRLWKFLQIGAIAPLLLSDVGFFQFRSALGFVLLAVLLVLVVYPLLQHRRIRPAKYALFCVTVIAAFVLFMMSDYWSDFMTRVDQTSYHQTSIFASRQLELEVFFNKMGEDVLWGKGLGGSFDASSVFLRQYNADRWRTVHFGIFSLVLRGGYLFLALLLSFFLPVLQRKHPQWYDNPCNIASVLFVPIILANIFLAPFLVSLPFVARYLWIALVMARLGTINRMPESS